MKLLVAGATGETGRRIVHQLVDRNISVKALVRDPVAARTSLPEGVELVVGDLLNRDSLRAGITDCTAVICATGARPSFNITGPLAVDYWGIRNLVDIAKEKQVVHFVFVSSLCVSKLFHPLNLFWLILFWKKQAEIYLQTSGLPYTIVRPGGLKNQDSETAIVMTGADCLFEGSIPRSQVARVCIEALHEPNARNKIVEIISRAHEPVRTLSDWFQSVP
ncbi:MAG: SDR family oxidoreductase [Synechococcales cyanobacterium]